MKFKKRQRTREDGTTDLGGGAGVDSFSGRWGL
jgi:hypothetical protein